jgi:hypothetical protein
LLKPKIFTHITALRLSLFFLYPQALGFLVSARLKFSKLCQGSPISSAFRKKKQLRDLKLFSGVKKAAKLFCNLMAFCFLVFAF